MQNFPLSLVNTDLFPLTKLIDLQTTYQLIGYAMPTQIGSAQEGSQLIVTGYTKANPGVVAVTAHGLQTDNLVTINGATAGWAPVNGTHLVTVTDANHFSAVVNTTGFAGNFDGTIWTRSPRTSQAVWAIQKIYLDGGGKPIRYSWAKGNTDFTNIWDNRTAYDYN